MNISGLVAGVLAGAAMLAGHYGQPALAAALGDPALAAEATTAVVSLGAIGAAIAGAMKGLKG